MAITLNDIKKDLQSDMNKVGRDGNGEFKFLPPSIVGRKLIKYPKLTVGGFEKRILPGNILNFTGLVSSETEDGIKYKVQISFPEIEFQTEPSAQVNQEIKHGERIKFHRAPSTHRSVVKLKCQCMDFRHRFEHPLHAAGGLIGAPRSYTRKTRKWPIGYPSVNSTNKLGVCKHIHSLLLKMKDEKMIKEF